MRMAHFTLNCNDANYACLVIYTYNENCDTTAHVCIRMHIHNSEANWELVFTLV